MNTYMEMLELAFEEAEETEALDFHQDEEFVYHPGVEEECHEYA